MPLLHLSEGDNTSAISDFLSEYRDTPNVVIQGAGAGVCYTYEPILITGERPKITGLTIEAEGTCLEFSNPFESLVDDMHIITKSGGLGVWCGLREAVEATDAGNYYKPWRGHEKGEVKRSYMSTFRDVFIYGDGDGWFIGGDYDWWEARKEDLAQGFSNHTRIVNGATYVQGQGMKWHNCNCALIQGHHMDARPYLGLDLHNSYNNRWEGGWIEPNWEAKKYLLPVVTGDIEGHGDIYSYPPPGTKNQWSAITTGEY